jgi:hypothetical protein
MLIVLVMQSLFIIPVNFETTWKSTNAFRICWCVISWLLPTAFNFLILICLWYHRSLLLSHGTLEGLLMPMIHQFVHSFQKLLSDLCKLLVKSTLQFLSLNLAILHFYIDIVSLFIVPVDDLMFDLLVDLMLLLVLPSS